MYLNIFTFCFLEHEVDGESLSELDNEEWHNMLLELFKKKLGPLAKFKKNLRILKVSRNFDRICNFDIIII